MTQNSATTDDDEQNHSSFPKAILTEELNSVRISSPDGERFYVRVSPKDLDRVDELAAKFGLERTESALNRRTYDPKASE